ncbi:MAG: amidohydrolase, partial [Cytophagia bacterium]|nr:amidohydrolase [Cytophagia bacterium]
MIKFFKYLFIIILFSGVVYYCIDIIQYKYNLMDIEDYEPISTLKVNKNYITKSKYPFVDVHNHQFDMPIKDLSKLVIEMDSLNMAYMVNLSGFRGIYLNKSLQ